MKFKKILKKLVLYLGAFIAVFSVTAGVRVGLFFITKGPDDAPGQDDSIVTTDNSLSKVLNNVMQTNNASLDLELQLSTAQTTSPIKLKSNVALNMPKMTAPAISTQSNSNGLELALKGIVEFNSQNINYDINYLNGTIYAKIGDALFKLDTNNLSNDLNKILNFGLLKKFGINVELPDLSGFNFDASMITSLASSMTEVDLEDGKELTINLFGYGFAKLITDNDYVLKSISLEDLNFNGTKIVADIQADLNAQKTTISEPENKEEINDFTNITKFLEIADKLLDKGYVSGKINVNLLKSTLTLDYYFDFSDFNNLSAYIKTSVFNNDFIMQLNSDKVLVKLNDYKYYFTLPFDVQEIIDSINYYAQKFGIELPTGEIESLVNSVNISNLNQILEYVGGLKIDGNGAIFEKNGIYLNLSTKNGEFDKITASYKNLISIDITLNEKIDRISLNENEFTNLLEENAFNLLHEQIIKNKCLALKADMVINDTPLSALIKIDCSNEIKIQLTLSVLGKNIVINVIDDQIFLEAENILKAKGSIEQIIKFAKNNKIIPQESASLDFETIKNLILSTLESSQIKFNITKENGHIKTLNMKKDNFSGDIYVVPFEEINFKEEGEYQDVENICNFVYNLLNIINGKKLSFNISASYKDYQISGKVQYINNKLLAKLSTTVLDKQVLLEIEGDIIFVNFDGLKLKTSIGNIKSLANEIKESLGLDISAIVDMADFDIDTLLNNSVLKFTNSKLSFIYNELVLNINADDLSIDFTYPNIQGQIELTEEFKPSIKIGYIDLDSLNGLLKATLKTLKNRSISGTVQTRLNLFNETNLLDINYAISLKDNKLIGYIHTYFKGLKVSAYLDNKDIYLDIASMKLHFNVDNMQEIIDWVNATFEQNISFNIDELLSVDKIKEINFDIIKDVVSSNNSATITFNNNLQITINFDEYINKVMFTQNGTDAELTCTDFEEISLDINKLDFKEYDFYTTIIDNIYQLIKSKRYDINALVNTYKNDSLTNSIDTKIQLDISSMLNAYIDILGLDQQITANYSNKMLFVRYGGVNGLKLSIEENALQEILSIICSALNIDTSSIPFLDEFLTKENIDTGNLSSIMPKIEMTNPLQYLEYIKGFELTNECFIITLKSSKLTNLETDRIPTIKLYYSNGKITKLDIEKIFTSKDSSDYISASVVLNQFDSVKQIENKEQFINISHSKDLIRAFVNTSNLNDWHINGKVKFDVKLGNLEIKAATVDVDIKITLDENKKPTIEAVVSGYPLVGLVNNKNTNGVGGITSNTKRNRSIIVAYKDGEIYLKTCDEKWGAYKELSRTTRITPSTLVNNLSYYIQYIFGFTDTIQEKIDSAIEKSMSYEGETNYGNIIEEYSKSGTSHTIKINLKELAHNDDIGTLTLVLTTINNDSTNSKDYIYRVDLDLRLLDDMMMLKTDTSSSTSGLYLTDIGSRLTLSQAEDLFSTHLINNFGQDGEYEKEGSKSWQQANSKDVELTFISNGEVIKTSTGKIASNISFPVMSNIVIDDSITRQEYEFAGWYLDEEYTTKFTSETYPRYSSTLFAKWNKLETKYYATVNFITNQNITVDSISGFIGDNLVLPICSNIEIAQDENTSILYVFAGWQTEDGIDYTNQTFTCANLTLYAKWNEVITKTYRVQIISGGEVVYDGKVASGLEFTFPSLPCFNENTIFYTSANFDENTRVTNFVVDSDKIWYAKNMYTVTVSSLYTTNGGNVYSSRETLYENSTITLPSFNDFTVDSGSFYTEYKFLGYRLNGSNILYNGDVLVPSFNANFVAEWKVTSYCIVTFNPSAWTNPAWWTISKQVKKVSNSNVSNTTNNQIIVEKGTSINLTQFVATCQYKYIGKSYNFSTACWAENVQNLYDTALSSQKYDGATEITINCHISLNPVWKHV